MATDLAVRDSFIASKGVSTSFTIEVRGTNISILSGSQGLLSYNDSSASAIILKKVGFYSFNNPGEIFFDNLVVNEIAPTITPGTVELAAYQSATGNLLADGNMEKTDTSSWQTVGTPKTVEKNTSVKHGGSRSLFLDMDGMADLQLQGLEGREGVIAPAGSVNGGDQVRIHGWFSNPPGLGGEFSVGLRTDPNSRYISGASIEWEDNSLSGWTEFTADWNSSITGPLYLVIYSTPGTGNSNKFYVDDVSVTVERYLPVNITTSVNNSVGSGTLTISPQTYLDPNRNYTLTLRGTTDPYTTATNVIRSIGGTPLEGPDITGNYIWNGLTTGTEICKIGKVEITFQKNTASGLINYGGSDLFTCAGDNCSDDARTTIAGNQHEAEANTYSTNGGPLGGPMTYAWSTSVNAPFSVDQLNVRSPLVTDQPTNGSGTVAVNVDGGVDVGTAKASANITVDLCENPWLGGQPSVPWTEAALTNFSLWYCLDSGKVQDTTDDLVDLTVQEVLVSPANPRPLKEYFYYDALNADDAIGIRVYANPLRLPLSEWFKAYVPNASGGSAGTLRGWQVLKAGRSLYVSAANDVGSGLYTNVYLISYSDKASAVLQGIYQQMIDRWLFMTNGVPDTDIAKVQRDMKRLDNMGVIGTSLASYEAKNNTYPDLKSGSYLTKTSTSVWPSWQSTLGTTLQTTLPKDPINNLNSTAGQWRFDEGTGITVADSSSFGNNGRMLNGTWASGADCKSGSCGVFNGTTSFVEVPDAPSLDLTDNLTISAWINLTDITGASDVDIILNKEYPSCCAYEIGVSDNHPTIPAYRFAWYLETGDYGSWMDGGFDVPRGAWSHVALTYDKSFIRTYLNGELKGTYAATGTIPNSSTNLRIGARGDYGPGNNTPAAFFNGSIDEVQVFGRALAQTEVGNMYVNASFENTGWNQDAQSFQCSKGGDYDSHIYQYQYESATDYSVYAAFEYDRGGHTWRERDITNPYAPCSTPSGCACYNYQFNSSDFRNNQRQVDIQNIMNAIGRFHAKYGGLPTTDVSPNGYGDGNPLLGGWDYGSQDFNGNGWKFLEFLAQSGIMTKIPLDPINDGTGDVYYGGGAGYAYAYYCYENTAGTNTDDELSLGFQLEPAAGSERWIIDHGRPFSNFNCMDSTEWTAQSSVWPPLPPAP